MASDAQARALGPYFLEEQIATGTTATIWRARDTRSGDDVAIKRFHAHLFGDRVARARMENEAKAAGRVRAQTVVSAIDVISRRDEFALVFPFVAGVPLTERLHSDPRLTSDEAARIAADVADALAAIHAAGLVHRDVKPGNILLGEDGRARLLDFGISRAVTDSIEVDQALTGAGLAIGTLPYMAPEQLAAQPAGSAIDVYALGVVLYEMLSGARPFSATAPVALVEQQRVAPPRIEGVPALLVDVDMHALAVDPTARPTAPELSTALRDWLALPLALETPTAPVTAVTAAALATPNAPLVPVRRRPSRIATGVLALVGGLVVGVVALAAVAPPSATPESSSKAAAVAQAPSASPRAKQSPSPFATPVAVQPVNTSRPSPQSTQQPPATQPPTPSATPTPPNHAHHRHKSHKHHHHKHHGRHHH
jgi:serine/threonine protein kinase